MEAGKLLRETGLDGDTSMSDACVCDTVSEGGANVTGGPEKCEELNPCPTRHGGTQQDVWEPDERLEQLHRVLLFMMKDFAKLCEKHNLRWFIAFGTAIGALRHKGFIPWDDDVDICMPREDLDRLVAVVQKGTDGRYSIMNSQTNSNYPMATTRFMLKGTEFRDAALQTVDFESCIFLDLFPLDNLADNHKLYRRQAWRAWLSNKLSIARSVGNPYIVGGGMRARVLRAGTSVARGVLRLPGVSSIDLNAICLREQTRYNKVFTQRVGFMCETERFAHEYDRDDIFPVRWVPFEDMMVPIAYRAEKLLTDFYGDFMTPPPLDQRHEHYPDILNFGDYANI